MRRRFRGRSRHVVHHHVYHGSRSRYRGRVRNRRIGWRV